MPQWDRCLQNKAVLLKQQDVKAKKSATFVRPRPVKFFFYKTRARS